jgi:hypothetical protein
MTDNIFAPLAAIAAPDAAQLSSRAQSALTMVESMAIDSPETYELAADELMAIKSKSKQLEEQRTSITGPINKALKAVNDLFRGPSDYLASAEKMIKGKMIAYTTEQERIAAEERRRAEAAIRAEQERIARETAEREAAAKAEADKLLAEGNAEAAAEVQAQAAIEAASMAATAEVMTAPVIEAPSNKVQGISSRSVWKARVTDKAELIAFVAANPQFANILDVNMSALNQMAKAMKGAMKIGGAEAYEEKTLAAGSR